MATPPRFGYVTDVRNLPSVQTLINAGITPLLSGWDPNLSSAYATLAASGINPGLWFPANSMGASEYAGKAAQILQTYPGASWADFNIEYPGAGPMGSPQYDYTEQVMAALMPYLKSGQFSASPMGMQGNNFNYNAVVQRGGYIFPEAYWGNMDPMDVQTVVQQLIDAGIPADRVRPLLGWGNPNPNNILSNLYAIDQGGWLGNFPTAGTNPLVIPTKTTPALPSARAPTAAGTTKPSSAKAVNYATQQIQQLFDLGLVKRKPQGDPAAAWRALSASPAVQSRTVNGVFNPLIAPKVMPPASMPVATNQQVQDYVAQLRRQFGV